MSNISTVSNTSTVQKLYDAFGRGDVSAILGLVADNVDWNNSAVSSGACPWNADFSGKSKLPGFFQTLSDQLQFRDFSPHTFIETGNHVAVLLHIASTLKKNGAQLANDSVHVWAFGDDGKVSKYRHYNDTGAELAAWNA